MVLHLLRVGTTTMSPQMTRAQTEMPAASYVSAKIKLLSSVIKEHELTADVKRFPVRISSIDGLRGTGAVKVQKSRLKIYKTYPSGIYARSQKILDVPLDALKLVFNEETLKVDINHGSPKWRTGLPNTTLKFENYVHFIVFLRQCQA